MGFYREENFRVVGNIGNCYFNYNCKWFSIECLVKYGFFGEENWKEN